MTLIEAVVVIFVIAFLVMMFLPAIIRPPHHHSHISCVNNLKQLGLAYKIWAGDNNDRYPMEVSVTNGGAMELVMTADAWKVFQVMSNELCTPKIIYCPEDSLHAGIATNWGDDLKTKISYFIGLDATNSLPTTLLAGDDNFILNRAPAKSGLINVSSSDLIEWNATRHGNTTRQLWRTKSKASSGNLLLNDGSVQMVSQSGLTNQISQTGVATNRLVIP